MTLFLRALILGYGTAVLAAAWLSAAGMSLWAAVLVAWVGGNVLALAFTAIGARLWPARPGRRSSFTVTDDELRLWDEDRAWDLIDAARRRKTPPAPVPPPGPAAAPKAVAAGQGAPARKAG